MTLLEVLLATSIASLLFTAALGWNARQTRLARTVTTRLEGITAARAVWRLLVEDLRLADLDRPAMVDRLRLAFRSASAGPDERAGLVLVTWRYDPERQALLRQRGREEERVVSTRLGSDIHFTRSEEGLELVVGEHRLPLRER